MSRLSFGQPSCERVPVMKVIVSLLWLVPSFIVSRKLENSLELSLRLRTQSKIAVTVLKLKLGGYAILNFSRPQPLKSKSDCPSKEIAYGMMNRTVTIYKYG